MTGEQIEYAFMAMTGVLATLVGMGWIDIRTPDRHRRRMRWAGPVLTISSLLLLAHALWP